MSIWNDWTADVYPCKTTRYQNVHGASICRLIYQKIRQMDNTGRSSIAGRLASSVPMLSWGPVVDQRARCTAAHVSHCSYEIVCTGTETQCDLGTTIVHSGTCCVVSIFKTESWCGQFQFRVERGVNFFLYFVNAPHSLLCAHSLK